MVFREYHCFQNDYNVSFYILLLCMGFLLILFLGFFLVIQLTFSSY